MVEILFNTIENIFAPLIALGPTWAIGGISVVIALMLSISYRILVNQSKMKYIREEIKDMQKKMNKAKKSQDQKELQKLFSKSMALNNQQLMLSIKPLFASMILISLFLPWFAHAYGDTSAGVTGNTGTYESGDLEIPFAITQPSTGTETPTITIEGSTYQDGDTITLGGTAHTIEFETNDGTIEKVKFKRYTANLPFSLPFFGNTVGWLGTYIIISMPFTLTFRKLLNVQ